MTGVSPSGSVTWHFGPLHGLDDSDSDNYDYDSDSDSDSDSSNGSITFQNHRFSYRDSSNSSSTSSMASIEEVEEPSERLNNRVDAHRFTPITPPNVNPRPFSRASQASSVQTINEALEPPQDFGNTEEVRTFLGELFRTISLSELEIQNSTAQVETTLDKDAFCKQITTRMVDIKDSVDFSILSSHPGSYEVLFFPKLVLD